MCVLCSSEVDPLFNYFCCYEKANWILSLKRPGRGCREFHKSLWMTKGGGGSSPPTTCSSLPCVLLKLFAPHKTRHPSPMASARSAITDSAAASFPPTHGHTACSAVRVLLWNELTPSLSPALWRWVSLLSFCSLAHSVVKLHLIL